MEKIINKIEFLKNTPSDINEHLQTLVDYSKECEHVTEFGVRWVISTWCFLLYPKKIIGYDILYDPNIEELKNIVNEYNIDFEYRLEDVLNVDIEQTDLLFIDTLHRYNQLIMELEKHNKKVNKYIILHDTNTFARMDEGLYDHASDILKDQPISKQGLKNAIDDFLKSEDGGDWFILKEYFNDNGLTILKRKNNNE